MNRAKIASLLLLSEAGDSTVLMAGKVRNRLHRETPYQCYITFERVMARRGGGTPWKYHVAAQGDTRIPRHYLYLNSFAADRRDG